MSVIVLLVGLVAVITSVAMMINSSYLSRIMTYIIQGRKITLAANVRIVCGIVFLIAAPFCSFVGAVFLLGAMMIISGAFVYSMGEERVVEILNGVLALPPTAQKIVLMYPLILGLLMIFSA